MVYFIKVFFFIRVISSGFLTTNHEFLFCPPCLYVKMCDSVNGEKELVLISFGEKGLHWLASGSTFFFLIQLFKIPPGSQTV